MADETPVPAVENPLLSIPPELVPEEWKDHVRDLRRENSGLRARMKDADGSASKAIADAVAKIKQEGDEVLTKTQQQANERIMRAELKAAALKAGMVDLDGLKLADLSQVKLTEDGDVDGADELMETLKKSKPYLFGVKTDTSTTKNPPPPKSPEARNAKDMTDEEYEKSKREMISGSKRR